MPVRGLRSRCYNDIEYCTRAEALAPGLAPVNDTLHLLFIGPGVLRTVLQIADTCISRAHSPNDLLHVGGPFGAQLRCEAGPCCAMLCCKGFKPSHLHFPCAGSLGTLPEAHYALDRAPCLCIEPMMHTTRLARLYYMGMQIEKS